MDARILCGLNFKLASKSTYMGGFLGLNIENLTEHKNVW